MMIKRFAVFLYMKQQIDYFSQFIQVTTINFSISK